MSKRTQILRVLVGSRAHGLADEGSDYDYRGVFVAPTREILSLAGSTKHTSWIEGDKSAGGTVEDDTTWEIAHFLRMATHSNPSVLEVFAAPVVEASPDGEALRALLPCVWTPKAVKDAFCGYSINQRKKMLEDKDGRSAKYACAYLRVLVQGAILLRNGVVPVDMTQLPYDREIEEALLDVFSVTLVGTEWHHWRSDLVEGLLRKWRAGRFTVGEVIDVAESVAVIVRGRAEKSTQKQDLGPVEAFLLDVRKRHWDG